MTFDVMFGLKWFIPHLSDLLHLTKPALYGRQRALVRAGLLKSRVGRGPGSGVELSAGSVAMLLVAVLATDNLSEVEEKTPFIANLKRTDKKGVRKAETLSAHIAKALSDDDAEDDLVIVDRTKRYASIFYNSGHTIYFTKDGKSPPDRGPGLAVTAEISEVIPRVRKLLKEHERVAAERRTLIQEIKALQGRELVKVKHPRGQRK
jgi:hypothetical protein